MQVGFGARPRVFNDKRCSGATEMGKCNRVPKWSTFVPWRVVLTFSEGSAPMLWPPLTAPKPKPMSTDAQTLHAEYIAARNAILNRTRSATMTDYLDAI